jgi:hypothetical protein
MRLLFDQLDRGRLRSVPRSGISFSGKLNLLSDWANIRKLQVGVAKGSESKGFYDFIEAGGEILYGIGLFNGQVVFARQSRGGS